MVVRCDLMRGAQGLFPCKDPSFSPHSLLVTRRAPLRPPGGRVIKVPWPSQAAVTLPNPQRMAGAVGAPNLVCGHRELLQSQPEDGEVGAPEQWPSRGRGNQGGWEGLRGTADLYSPSPHVSLCFTAFVVQNNLQKLPFLCKVW